MKRISKLLLALVSGAIGCGIVLPGCSSSSSSPSASAGAGGSAGHGGAASSVGRAGGGLEPAAGAGAGGASSCYGDAPFCRGLSITDCCGQDPYGRATCENGAWLCSLAGSDPIPAPGCNGQFCGSVSLAGAGGQSEGGAAGQAGDVGSSQAGATSGGESGCTGQTPNCFGSNLQTCCGKDPSGQAKCENGNWTCSGVLAPGCNGQSCI